MNAEGQWSINFTGQDKKFVLSLHYNGSSSYLYINDWKAYQFKAKDSKSLEYPLCLGNSHTKYISLNNQQCVAISTLIDLNPE